MFQIVKVMASIRLNKRICEGWGEGSGLGLWITDCNMNNYVDAGESLHYLNLIVK